MSGSATINFVIGSRPIARIPRRLGKVDFTLAGILADSHPALPDIGDGDDGLRIYSAPVAQLPAIRERYRGCAIHDRYRYRRCYIDMEGGFDAYLQKFSSRTRSTLKRKSRKLAELNGGTLDIRAYATPAEVEAFLVIAIDLSARTYQERLLGAGLPDDAAFRERALDLAARDELRCFLLFVDGKPISYLYLPIRDGVLIYDHLGYDSDYADLSPGTVLQVAALERLFAEHRYRYFDFTEGEGAHKQLFATGAVECATITVLRPGIVNRMILGGLTAFDAVVAGARAAADHMGKRAALSRLIRR